MQRFPQLYGNVQQGTSQARARSSSIGPSNSQGDNSASAVISSSADSSISTSTGVSSSAPAAPSQSRRRGGGGYGFGANPRFAKGRWGSHRSSTGRSSSVAPRSSSASSSVVSSGGPSSRPARRNPLPAAASAAAGHRGAQIVINESDPRIRGTEMLPTGRTREEQDHYDANDDEEGGNIRYVGSEEEWITCVTESKGSGQRTVGIAAFQPSTASCILTQLNDSQTYVKTMHTLSIRWPSIILTPGAAGLGSSRLKAIDPSAKSKVEETLLLKALQASFGAKTRARGGAAGDRDRSSRAGSVTSSFRAGAAEEGMQAISAGDGIEIAGLSRRFFDANAGLTFVSELIVNNDDTPATLAAMQGKYYALSAASALFKFIEMTSNTFFVAGSIKIQYAPLEGTMLIDGESAKNLELVENIMDRKSKQCLFRFLNHCYTPMAIRLLRTNILSPLTDAPTIDTRLDAVAELIANHERFRALRKAMRGLERIDADKLTGTILASTSVNQGVKMQQRKQLDMAKESERKLSVVLQLRTFLKAIPGIKTALTEEGGCQSNILETISKILADTRLKEIENEIQDTLNENMLEAMTKTSLSARTSRVFAIRAEKKKLLDVARETFKENIADVDELLKELQQKYPDILDSVDLQYNSSNGFTFALAESVLEEKGLDLPRMFNKLAKKGKKIVFSCVDLLKRNQRIQQSLDEVFLLSSDVLDELFEAIRKNIAALYRTSEVIAMLDMLCAFTNVATNNSSYTRPEFTDTLAIKDGRHPVLEKYAPDKGFVPNDTYATEAASFQLLTGPNMSGKTTFLKQIATLVVMSQIGSYIPAEYASFKLHNALLTRLSNDDSIEGNLSTFALEMKTMGMILSALQSCDNALVIVDELGRGTSPQEGVGIAHAIAEDIIKQKSFCFFATHFHDLSTTLSMYPNVVSLHLETDIAQLHHEAGSTSLLTSSKDFNMSFSHRVRDGVTTTPNYGLEIAKVAALPDMMLDEARLATAQLMNLYELRKKDAVGTQVATRRKTILEVAGRLRQAYNSHRLSDHDLAIWINKISDEAIETLTRATGEGECEDNEVMDREEEENRVPSRAASVEQATIVRSMNQASSRGTPTGTTGNAYSHMLEDEFEEEDQRVRNEHEKMERSDEGDEDKMEMASEGNDAQRLSVSGAHKIAVVREPTASPLRRPSPSPSPVPDAGRVPLFAPKSPYAGDRERSMTLSPRGTAGGDLMNPAPAPGTPASPAYSYSARQDDQHVREAGRSPSYVDDRKYEMGRQAFSQSQDARDRHRILAEQSWGSTYAPAHHYAPQSQAGPFQRGSQVPSSPPRERLSSEALRRHSASQAPMSQTRFEIGSSAIHGNPAFGTPPLAQDQPMKRDDDQGTEVMSDVAKEDAASAVSS